MTRFRRLASTSAVLTLVLVAVGGLVRATGSGLGCLTEWPTCHGGWVAPLEYTAVIEYSHRALAGIVVLLLIAQAVAARRWASTEPGLRRWSDAAVAVVFLQAALGRVVVTSELHAAYVTAHLILALTLVGATTRVAAGAFVAGRRGADGRVGRMTVGALAGTALVLLVGAYVRERGAGLAFGDWPLMGGGVLPDGGTLQWVHFLHRVLAALVFGHVIALTLRTRRDLRKPVRMWGWTVLGLYSAQILVGAANVWTRLAPAAVLGHVIGGALTWASLVALLVVSRRAEVVRGREEAAEIPATEVPASAEVSKPSDAPSAHHASVVGRLGAYIQLTKPRIVVLLLVTTVPAMVLAAGGFPPLWLVAATLAGGILTSGSANAINQYLERDIDSKMQRTRRRPLPMHRVPPGRALVFGLLLGLIGTLWLAVVVNPLAAGLAAGAIGFYVVVYTMLLKRNTPQNIVIGGAAGAVPVLVGWAAVTGSLAAPAWIMFAIIFFWTPPHFWALAMRYREDYANAGVPMLPVVRTAAQTTAQILLYSVILVPVTLLLFPAARLGPLYLATATGLGAVFVWLAVRLWRAPTTARAMTLFKYSVNYLGILFAAIALDRLLA